MSSMQQTTREANIIFPKKATSCRPKPQIIYKHVLTVYFLVILWLISSLLLLPSETLLVIYCVLVIESHLL